MSLVAGIQAQTSSESSFIIRTKAFSSPSMTATSVTAEIFPGFTRPISRELNGNRLEEAYAGQKVLISCSIQKIERLYDRTRGYLDSVHRLSDLLSNY
jgi:hypothetical protein